MKKTLTLFISLCTLSACTSGPSKNLLGLYAEESYPENEAINKRLTVYIFPHQNALGDQVSGTWVRVEDPR